MNENKFELLLSETIILVFNDTQTLRLANDSIYRQTSNIRPP